MSDAVSLGQLKCQFTQKCMPQLHQDVPPCIIRYLEKLVQSSPVIFTYHHPKHRTTRSVSKKDSRRPLLYPTWTPRNVRKKSLHWSPLVAGFFLRSLVSPSYHEFSILAYNYNSPEAILLASTIANIHLYCTTMGRAGCGKLNRNRAGQC